MKKIIALCLLITLMGCASKPIATIPDPLFPQPESLTPAVSFWKNVYAKWGLGQVVLHDNRYLDVVYEVIDLPSDGEGITTASRDLITDRLTLWQTKLQILDDKLAQQHPLNEEEQQLVNKLNAAGGTAALTQISDRLRRQRGMKERFMQGVIISQRYLPTFKAIFVEAGLPADLALLPHVESSFQYHAKSHVGAAGIWQFMPSTGREYMRVNKAIDERLDPVFSAQAAATYLGRAHNRLAAWPLAITSYNHGVSGMVRAQAQYGNDIGLIVQHYDGASFKFASRNFYAEFLAAREIANNASHYFGVLPHYPALTEDVIRLQDTAIAPDIARYFEIDLNDLISLNKAWLPRSSQGLVALPAGMQVWLPQGTLTRTKVKPSSQTIAWIKDSPTTLSR